LGGKRKRQTYRNRKGRNGNVNWKKKKKKIRSSRGNGKKRADEGSAFSTNKQPDEFFNDRQNVVRD